MERIKNIKIFISACGQLKVNSRLTESDIERLKPEDWEEIVKTIQLFSNKVEKNYPQDVTKKSFNIHLTNLKLSINQLINEWNELKLDDTQSDYVYDDEVYLSPYEDSIFNFEDMYDMYDMVRGKLTIVNHLKV